MPRIVTYNVHRCVGNDRRLDVGRIADVLARLQPDIVALQELDVGRARTGGADQAHEIAARLKMTSHFHPAVKVEEELYGDAILTTLPERLIQAGPLPGHPLIPALEPRGALWIEADVEGGSVQVINTHLAWCPRNSRSRPNTWPDHPGWRIPASWVRVSCWGILTPRPARWSTAR